jgi:hypothetical protein
MILPTSVSDVHFYLGDHMSKQKKAPWKTHLEETLKFFSKRYKDKFTRGVKEHGGNLHRKPAIEMVEWSFDEVLDLVSYQSVLRSHVLEIKKIIDDSLSSPFVFSLCE